MEYDEHNNIWASQYLEDRKVFQVSLNKEQLHELLSEFTESLLLAVQESLAMNIDDVTEGFAKEVIEQHRHHKHSDILVMTDNEFIELCKELSDLIVEEIANEPVPERLAQAAEDYKADIKVYHGMEAYEGKAPTVPFAGGGTSMV